MVDKEFQQYVDLLIEKSFLGCSEKIKHKTLERCKNCIHNVGQNKYREIICTKEIFKEH